MVNKVSESSFAIQCKEPTGAVLLLPPMTFTQNGSTVAALHHDLFFCLFVYVNADRRMVCAFFFISLFLHPLRKTVSKEHAASLDHCTSALSCSPPVMASSCSAVISSVISIPAIFCTTSFRISRSKLERREEKKNTGAGKRKSINEKVEASLKA